MSLETQWSIAFDVGTLNKHFSKCVFLVNDIGHKKPNITDEQIYRFGRLHTELAGPFPLEDRTIMKLFYLRFPPKKKNTQKVQFIWTRILSF